VETNQAALGDGKLASAVETPETLAALRDALPRLASSGLAIYPQGGRTALDYGGIPSKAGVALDLRRLNRVVDYPFADMTITVEAGLTMQALQETLAVQGQRLPIDCPRPERATLGGVYATNSSGSRRFGAGRPRDFIIGVAFVTHDGRLIRGGGRVVKNVAGYDFPKLMTGSMGTLGVLAELTLKIVPRPESSSVAWIACDRLETAIDALGLVHSDGIRPMAVELLNATASAQIRGAGVPAPECAWCLAIGVEDNRASVRFQVDAIAARFGGAQLTLLHDGDAESSWTRLAELSNAAEFPMALVATVPPSAVGQFVADLDAAKWCVQAHAGSGIVRLGRAQLGFDESLVRIADEVAELRARAVASGGALTIAQAPTDWKARLNVWGSARPDWAWMSKLKATFDPGGVLNPGRFVGNI
jgi:glycolate oxidase FAD binding subunit